MKNHISIAVFVSMIFLVINNVEAQNKKNGPFSYSDIDKNEDKSISEKEFNSFIAERKKNNLNKGNNIKFADVDKDSNGKVTEKEFDEFMAIRAKRHRDGRVNHDPKQIFAKIDTNSDKYITEEEMSTFKKQKDNTGKKGKKKGSNKIPSFDKLDKNNDGEISQDEFVSAYNEMRKNKHKK